jgi:coenzyme F420-reducing hydrogenase gamma subunit
MTPEERAREVCSRYDGDYYLDGCGPEEDIASAIRAAEDDALERAAQLYYAGEGFKIRSLKSAVRTPGGSR